MVLKFHIHGDNIVECERAFDLILQGMNLSKMDIQDIDGTISCPRFNVKYNDINYVFTFFPGFGRWNEDILKQIKARGGILREIADVIITKIENEIEVPLLMIEFSGALPAGNQAWQRSGRAYSAGKANIPYLYVADIGGYELNSDREKQSIRLPNPALPFSYLSFSEISDKKVFSAYTRNAGTSNQVIEDYSDVFGELDLIEIMRKVITGEDYSDNTDSLKQKEFILVKKIADGYKVAGNTLSKGLWSDFYNHLIENKETISFIKNNNVSGWKKMAYIKKHSIKLHDFLSISSEYAIGITSTSLPFALITDDKRVDFANDIINLYPDLDEPFKLWLSKPEDLVITYIMGFKPAGDDARPDRGLPPFVKMLVGENVDLLTYIYGPALESTWDKLEENPGDLADSNGLWEVILNLSDGLLADTYTNQEYRKGFLKNHWHRELPVESFEEIIVDTVPLKYTEQDIDTFIHTLFVHFGKDQVFEGLCNPPGGDWSGISIISKESGYEKRWLSLPRVSGSETKRPDHIIQIKKDDQKKDILLIIESKETLASVKNEGEIGLKLVKYVTELIKSDASIKRVSTSTDWQHSSKSINPSDYHFVSATASKARSHEDLVKIAADTKSDLLIGVKLYKNQTPELFLHSTSLLGTEVKEYMLSLIDSYGLISFNRQ